jgi:ribonuclease P protein component
LLPKVNRLRSGDEIRAIVKSGKRLSNSNFTIHYREGSGRFAFVTPKTIGGAVVRNLVRRRARAIVSKHLERLSELDAVIRFHPSSSQATWSELLEGFENQFGRLGQ